MRCALRPGPNPAARRSPAARLHLPARIARAAALALAVSLVSSLASSLVPSPAFATGPSSGSAAGADDAPPVFDGQRALDLASDLVKRGERFYGAAGRRAAIEELASLLQPHAQTLDLQPFKAREPVSGVEYELVNVIARRNPDARPRILLASHFDTRLWAEEDPDPSRHEEPIPGADDGTSGVAVLIELLRVVASTPGLREIGLDVVLFDGEEFGRPGNDAYCQGSRHYVETLARHPRRGRPDAAIVIDMVGDRSLRIRREKSSHEPLSRWLSDLVWKHGRRMTPDVFVDRPIGPIIDDQTPFQKAGIPATLVIDLEYPYWHTHQDTVDKLSARSLDIVGHTLIAALPAIERELARAAGPSTPHSTDAPAAKDGGREQRDAHR